MADCDEPIETLVEMFIMKFSETWNTYELL